MATASSFRFVEVIDSLDTSGSGGIDFSQYVNHPAKQGDATGNNKGFWYDVAPLGEEPDRDCFGGVINYNCYGSVVCNGKTVALLIQAEEYLLDALKKSSDFMEMLGPKTDPKDELNLHQSKYNLFLKIKRSSSFFNI